MFKVIYADPFLIDVTRTSEFAPGSKSILEFVEDKCNLEREDVSVVYKCNDDVLFFIEQKYWKGIRPKEGEYMVYVKPKNKNTLSAALTVALVAAGQAYAVPAIAGAFGTGAFGTAIISAGVTMAATYLSQQIIPIDAPDTPKADPKESSTLDIRGTQNTIKTGAPVPYLIGTTKVTPPLATNPIREAHGQDVQLTQVFCFGYGPIKGLTEDNIRIGSQPLTDFTDYELQIQDQRDTAYSLRREDPDGWTSDIVNKITLVTGDIQDSPQNVLIKQSDEPRIFTSAPNTEELGVELTFNGLVRFDDKGKRRNRTVNVQIEYRKIGDSEWTGFDANTDGANCEIVLDQYSRTFDNGYDHTGRRKRKSYQCNDCFIVLPSGFNIVPGQEVRVITNGTGRTYNVYSVYSSIELKGTKATDSFGRTDYVTLTGTVLKVGGWNRFTYGSRKEKPKHYGKLTGSTTNAFLSEFANPISITSDSAERYFHTTKATDLTKGSYEVRVTRLTDDTDDSKIRDKFSVTNIRSIQRTDDQGNEIVPFPPEFCYVALKIKASDQLNETIKNLSCVCSSVVERYSEEDNDFIEDDDASGNNAWEFLKLLTGPANKRFIQAESAPDDTGGEVDDWGDIIDLDAFLDWAAVCDEQVLSRDGSTLEPRYRYNTVVDYETTVGELARKIASTGRASNSMIDGKYSIIYDTPGKPAVSRLTPANTYGFSASKTFARIPDALRCKFANKDKNYNVDEVIIKRNDNDVLVNDSLIQDINCDGITDPDQVYRYAKYALAQMVLRPEEYRVSTGIEHKYFRRGDVVSMTHDKIQGVLHYSRVKSISGNDVELDQAFQLDSATKITFRYAGTEIQDLSVYDVFSVDGATLTLNAVPSELQVGDIAIAGTDAESITQKYIVKEKTPGTDDSCEVALVDYADPAIFDAENGIIQDYSPVDSVISIDQYADPAKPVAISVVTDEEALLIGQDGSLITRAGFVVKEPEAIAGQQKRPSPSFIQVQYRSSGSTGDYKKETFDFTNDFVYVAGLQDEQSYDFRIRFITEFGIAGEFLLLDNVLIIGKSSPPENVQGFSYIQQKDGILLEWLPNEELDVKEYEIRKGFNWDSGFKIDRLRTNQKLVSPLESGNYQYHIKAIDVVDNFSENASLLNVNIVNPSKPTGINAETIDNNINLRWSEPVSGFKIDYYNVYKETLAVVGGFQKIGYTYTTFFTRFETDAGTYTYYVEPVDIAGNIGERSSLKVELDVPPDYVLVDNQLVDLNSGDANNGKFFRDTPATFDTTEITFDTTADFTFDIQKDTSVLFTVDTNKTYADFLSELSIPNTFDSTDDYTFDNDVITFDSGYTLQDVIDQGYVYWMQKSYVSGGYYEVVVDYGTIIDSTRVTVTDTWETLVDGLDKEYILSRSQDGITYDNFTGTNQFFRDFRYVKFRINLTEKTGSIRPLETLQSIQFKLDIRKKYDSGNGIIDVAADGKVVVFNQNFLDVQSITMTAKTDGTVAKYALYDFDNAGDQSEFTAYLFDINGNRDVGEFSWSAEGF